MVITTKGEKLEKIYQTTIEQCDFSGFWRKWLAWIRVSFLIKKEIFWQGRNSIFHGRKYQWNRHYNDILGNSTILNKLETGDVFAETYAITGTPMMVDVVAAQACKIVFFNVRNLLENAKNSSLAQKITRNLLFISMQKNLILSSRIFCTSPKTIRERLAIYFSEQVTRTGSTAFDIPFNRQQMADYLNLDRSALSKELGKMQDEGLIRYRKNHFEMVKFKIWFCSDSAPPAHYIVNSHFVLSRRLHRLFTQ